MRSSPAEDQRRDTASWRLQELCACWDQAYEALVRADLDRVAALLDVADGHLAALPADPISAPDLAALTRAEEANGRLAAGMRAGLDGLQGELAVIRRGLKALKSYGDPGFGLGDRVESRA